jgi:hypothetical protein
MLIALLSGTLVPGIQRGAESADDASGSRVESLLKERHDVLANRLEALTVLMHAGAASPADVINARDDLLASELELAPSRDRRIEILRARVDNLKSGEEYTASLKMLGKATEVDFLAAKARRLQMEIELERFLASEAGKSPH